MEEPKEKRDFYKVNYGLIAMFFFLKTIDVIFTWYLISKYGIGGEMNLFVRLVFGKYGLDLFIFYVPIVGFLIFNYHYRKDLFLMKAEFYSVLGILVVLYLVVLNNLFAILLAY